MIIGLDKRLDRPVYNPDGEGLVPIANLFARSRDAGSTWSPTWPLDGQPIPQTASQGLLTLPDGDVLMTFETFKEYDEAGPWRYKGGMLRSHDEGRTWGEQVISAASDFEGDPHDTMWWDPRIARLADGTLVQFYYAFRHRDERRGPGPRRLVDGRRADVDAADAHLARRARRPTRSRCRAGGRAHRLPAAARPAPARCVAHYSARRRADVRPRVRDGGLRARPDLGRRGRRLAGLVRLPDLDGPLHVRPSVRRAARPDRALVVWYAGGLTRTAIHAAELRLVA